MSRFRIDVANEQELLPIDARQLRRAVRSVLEGEGLTAASVSVAVVDNAAIHRLNAKYLDHDEPTDALSFVLEATPGRVEGQIIVSAEMAAARAAEFEWTANDELLLYVIHAALHLAGYDDTTKAAAARMRQKERRYLALLAQQIGQSPRAARLPAAQQIKVGVQPK
jgi:probable rRNA maturation factor